jgi:glycosyltransferase involved in cell wall biosynthesis
MRVQIISELNGWGLSRDVDILRGALIGISGEQMEVVYTDWRSPKPGRYDLNIFLELLNPAFYGQAKRNVLVPNPEWFMRDWVRHLKGLDAVWCKTRDAVRIFGRHHQSVEYVGWTSMDRLIADVPRERALIHAAGDSVSKGTRHVIAAMERLPHYQLTLITSQRWGPLPGNITLRARMDDAEFVIEQNRHMVHLCPSTYEGFGHYINEARSVGAFIITTNAPPMNELVTADYGIGCAVASSGPERMGYAHQADPEELANCIRWAMEAPEELLRVCGVKARAAYIAGRNEFDTNLIRVIS